MMLLWLESKPTGNFSELSKAQSELNTSNRLVNEKWQVNNVRTYTRFLFV